MQTELQKIACDKTHSLAVYYVQPFDKLIGKHIEADACQVQAGRGNLYRHGSYTVKPDLILSHTGRPEAFIRTAMTITYPPSVQGKASGKLPNALPSNTRMRVLHDGRVNM